MYFANNNIAPKDRKYSRDTSLAWKEGENNKVNEVH